MTVRLVSVEATDGVVVDNEDGTYDATYNIAMMGTYSLLIRIADVDIFGSPYSVQNLDANQKNPITGDEATFAFGDGLLGGVVGAVREFDIQAVSVNMRNQIRGGDNFTVVVRGPVDIPVSILDLEIGRYTVTYQPLTAGTYTLYILLQQRSKGWGNISSNGELPKQITFVPGDVDPPSCTARAPRVCVV